MIQSENHVFAGLLLDLAVSKQLPEYLIDAHNIRFTARNGETLLSITNEKGPKELTIKNSLGSKTAIEGTILGYCALNNYLVLFVHNDNNSDSILRIDMSYDEPLLVVLFKGNLGFNLDYPIDTVGDYENENILKIYWTDGLNQPRVINIVSNKHYDWAGAFDFVPSLLLNETITVTRTTNASGNFHAGVILYAFSYYNKYGQESNLFHVTPLYYISFHDRGGSPESTVSNAFTIKVQGVDKHFDYLRIYSIMRTSLDATPTCKRILDIAIDSIEGNTATYIDTGTNGDLIDPSSLLYIGGEEIVATNICAKDGTLFLGNIELKRPNINNIKNFAYNIKSSTVKTSTATETLTYVSPWPYNYYNGLNTLAAGFKNREHYRIGLQAQYKNGKWSEPIHIKDYQIDSSGSYPALSGLNLTKLIIECIVSSERVNELVDAGYKKIRPVVVFPGIQDRTVLCLGVVNPTMYTNSHRNDNDLYAQSSWFFRPMLNGVSTESAYADSSYYSESTCSPVSYSGALPYASNSLTWDPKVIRAIEVQGNFDSDNLFRVDWSTLTFHSPELSFDDSILHIDLTGVKCRQVGLASFKNTLSDIDILTSSPTISNGGSGFVHQSFSRNYSCGITAGLFYDDYVVDDHSNGSKFKAYPKLRSSVKWMLYPWNKNGSLNNDINRPAEGGSRTAVLSKKVISNLRYADTIWGTPKDYNMSSSDIPLIFSSNEVAIVKIGSNIYKGNIDTLLAPDDNDGMYFAFGIPATTSSDGTNNLSSPDINTPFTSISWWKTWSEQPDAADKQGLYKRVYRSNKWKWDKTTGDIADYTPALATNKESVRMKYKSTPHIVLKCSGLSTNLATSTYPCVLPIVEIYKEYNEATAFGGTSQDALRANRWVPAGKAISIVKGASCKLKYEYGDTWFSRYDCLKTYPFTMEDTNQIVEIGSFMLETRINIDGRYDRNRGQSDNTNMSPINFNLLNPVYSQRDDFFSYFILDDDYYRLTQFPNQITWSTEKHAGQDVDPWTQVTLASVYNMDGSKGQIRSLNVWKDNIYCFLDNEVSNILFNSRVQIPTSDGVPIEIANNYKVDGKRCILDGAGCINRYSICPTPMALYFIDSVGGHLQAISEGLTDLSFLKNMVTWLSRQKTNLWTPNDFTIKLFYDRNNKDLYIVTEKEALCYSEALGLFTSFMSYSNIPVMFNAVDKFYCIKSNYLNEMFSGDYNYFFGEFQGYDFTFVSNGKTNQGDLSGLDKIYNNIEFRADKWSDKLDSILSSESPFDYIRLWNEYQDTGEVLLTHRPHKPSILKKKFRVWRIQVPRDAHNRTDRIRNTWCKVKFGSAPRYNNGNNGFILFHDIALQYFV